MKKFRIIPNINEIDRYERYITTIGSSKASKNLMKILGQSYNEGDDYFGILKHLHDFNKIIKAISVVKDQKVRGGILHLVYVKKKQTILDNENVPYIIRSHAANVLSYYYRLTLK